jgi:hypothetical protein
MGKQLSASEFGHGTQKHSQESHERDEKQMKTTTPTIIPAQTAPANPQQTLKTVDWQNKG